MNWIGEKKMAKKTKAKKISFRQRLRNQCADRLDVIIKASYDAVDKAKGNSHIGTKEIMRLCSGGQTKTLREDLITQLANETEAELEAIYNKQMNLLPEDPDADKKES
jgi:hypothetical protein